MTPRKPKKTPKTAGSRRWQAQVERHGTRESWDGGVPKGQERVALRFVCRNHTNRVLGFFALDTFDGAQTDSVNDVCFAPLHHGIEPLAEVHNSHTQVRLICEEQGCPIDVVYTIERVHKALRALWSPHAQRVVTRPVP